MRRQGAKNSRQNARTPAETKIREVRGRKSPQKRPIWRRIENGRFAETGWWCAQSDTNPSPCYLAENPCFATRTGKSRRRLADPTTKNAAGKAVLSNHRIAFGRK